MTSSFRPPCNPLQQTCLDIGDLSPAVTRTDLFTRFSVIAPVLSLRLCRCLLTGKSLYYAYVNFYSHLDVTEQFLQQGPGLTKIQRVEWNNRGIYTVHAIFISALSLYFVFWSRMFSDEIAGLIVFRSSPLSTFGLGVSVGYFLSDLGTVLWLYPSLVGIEYVIHHTLSGIAVAYSMFMGEAHLYTYMVLISEVTTPEINIRRYVTP